MTVTHIDTRQIKLADLHPHPDNPNHGDVDAIAASLGEFGQYRAVVALTDGTILAGHHVVEALRQRGDTHARVDVIDTDQQTAKRIMLADNRTAELGEGLDPEQLLAVLDTLDTLDGTGYTDTDVDDLLATINDTPPVDDKESPYTRQINVPHYNPSGTPPSLDALIDRTRTTELEQQIAESKVPADIAEVLIHCAQRHTVIDFHRVADYYAHAPAPVQRLMEDQALVIVDLQSAIRNGYVKLTDAMSNLLEEETDDEDGDA